MQALEEEKESGSELSEAKEQLEQQLQEAEKQIADTSGTLHAVCLSGRWICAEPDTIVDWTRGRPMRRVWHSE